MSGSWWIAWRGLTRRAAGLSAATVVAAAWCLSPLAARAQAPIPGPSSAQEAMKRAAVDRTRNPLPYRVVVPDCGETNRPLYLVKPRITGVDVAELQARLRALGFFSGKIDGVFGPSTDAAVRAFQQAVDIPSDGVVTQDTWLKMATRPARTLPALAADDVPGGELKIVVDVTKLTLTLYSDDKVVKQYPIAIGKWRTPTPIGEFAVIEKDYAPGGAFGSRWMGLNVPWGGYGIHGTNRPWSIGSAASAGCIRMFNEDVEELFEIVPIKTRVFIIGYEPEGEIERELGPGATGQDVQVLQYYLRRESFDAGPLDGRFGERVEAAVKELQKFYGAPVTGRVGMNELYLLGLR